MGAYFDIYWVKKEQALRSFCWNIIPIDFRLKVKKKTSINNIITI